MGKGEIARYEQFLLFPQRFLSIWRTFCHFHQIKNCCLQTLSIWNRLKFAVWERVNSQGHIMAVGEATVFPGFLTQVLTQLSFQSHQLLFSHASTEVRRKNTPERKFASIGYQTHNHQVINV